MPLSKKRLIIIKSRKGYCVPGNLFTSTEKEHLGKPRKFSFPMVKTSFSINCLNKLRQNTSERTNRLKCIRLLCRVNAATHRFQDLWRPTAIAIPRFYQFAVKAEARDVISDQIIIFAFGCFGVDMLLHMISRRCLTAYGHKDLRRTCCILACQVVHAALRAGHTTFGGRKGVYPLRASSKKIINRGINWVINSLKN